VGYAVGAHQHSISFTPCSCSRRKQLQCGYTGSNAAADGVAAISPGTNMTAPRCCCLLRTCMVCSAFCLCSVCLADRAP
jgi:hypothetical protein